MQNALKEIDPFRPLTGPTQIFYEILDTVPGYIYAELLPIKKRHQLKVQNFKPRVGIKILGIGRSLDPNDTHPTFIRIGCFVIA